MIVFENVSKYRLEHGIKRYILRDVSLVLPDGARLAYFSGNRNDGTAFLNMISGVVPPDEGRITTNSKISWIFGKPIGIVKSLSARKNINIICGINGLGRGKANKIADMVASFTGLGQHIDEPMSTYTNEMRKRVEFALSLAIRFDYFLIRGNNFVGSGKFKRKSQSVFLKTINKAGVIVASPNLKFVREICDSCLVVINGEAHMYDDLEEGIAAYKELRATIEKMENRPIKKAVRRNAKSAKRMRNQDS